MCLGATLFYALFSTVRYPKAKQDKSSKKRYEVGGEYIYTSKRLRGDFEETEGRGSGQLNKVEMGELDSGSFSNFGGRLRGILSYMADYICIWVGASGLE